MGSAVTSAFAVIWLQKNRNQRPAKTALRAQPHRPVTAQRELAEKGWQGGSAHSQGLWVLQGPRGWGGGRRELQPKAAPNTHSAPTVRQPVQPALHRLGALVTRPRAPGVGPRLCHGMLRPHTEASPRAPQLSPCPDPAGCSPWELRTAPLSFTAANSTSGRGAARVSLSVSQEWGWVLNTKAVDDMPEGQAPPVPPARTLPHSREQAALGLGARGSDAPQAWLDPWSCRHAAPPNPCRETAQSSLGPQFAHTGSGGVGAVCSWVLGPSFLAPLLRALP